MDKSIFLYLNHALAHPVMDDVMLFVSSRWTWLFGALPFLGWALLRGNRKLLEFCIVIGVGIGLSDLITYQVLKPAFARERPCHQLEEEVRLVPPRCGGDFGFPSNHAANGMTTAVLAALWLRRPLAVAVLVSMAVLVGFSRIYLGVHFPGDVLAGFGVGATLACGLYAAYAPLRRRIVARLKAGRDVLSGGA